MIDIVPKSLELLFVEVVVQRILLDFRLPAIVDHAVQSVFIKDALHQRMDTFGNFCTALRERCQYAICQVSAVFFCYMVVPINIRDRVSKNR